jgi:hypothetical protein
MADFKISDLTQATVLDDDAWLEISFPGTPRLTRRVPAKWFGRIVKDVACSDEVTPLTTGVKVVFRWKQIAITQSLKISASLTTAQATGATLLTLDVKKNGTTLFTTKPTFDNTEKTTETAATAAVLSSSAIAYDDEISIEISALTAGSVAAGLKVYFEGKA